MTKPTWEQAIEYGPAGRLQEPYQTRWDSISAGISHVYFASDEDYDEALGRELTEDEFDRLSKWDWERQKRVIAVAFFELLRLDEEKNPEWMRQKLADSLEDLNKWSDLVRNGEAEVTSVSFKRVEK